MSVKTGKKKIISLFLAISMICSMMSSIIVQADESDAMEGLQVWYKFDETSGTVAKDSSGNNRDANVMGGGEWITTADKEGVALELDNTKTNGKYVDIPVSVMENVTGDFTISTWIKVEDCPTWGRILDYGTSASNVMLWTANSYYFKMDNDDNKSLEPPRNGTLPQFRQGCPLSFLWPESYSTPRWQHVTITREGNTSTLWINGIRWDTNDYETVNPRTGEDYKFYIGKSNWAADPYASMAIRDFRVYNRSLSINEINNVMAEGEWADEIQVHYAMESVALGELSAVKENLYLPTTVNDRVKVEWSSDSAALEASENIGVVNRPEAGDEAVTATLTGKFSYGDYSESMDYQVTILPKEETDTEYTMTVDTQNPLHEMSPTMYGLFFEDLSLAGDGGLYAELLRNTCFHDDENTIPYWNLYTSDGAEGSMSLDKENNLNDVQFQHLKLDITTLPDNGYVGIRNEGYNGMKLEEGSEYELTFFARTDDFNGSISAKFLSVTGETISEAVKVDSITSEWKQYTLTLTPDEYAAQGQLVIYCEGGTGSVHFDVVSLFPEDTYKGHGLRKDMVEYLEALNPTFLRFPGGCYVEGDTMADAFRWKNTLYGKENRAGHASLWNYRVTDGLGYYEFLELCDDLDIEPMYVCGVGIAHRDSEDWQYWIQDVLDAIEFANGDVTTKWGAVRAEMGHPEPFNMKYVEIGNEAFYQPALYEPRYQDFYDAIKEKYPDMNIIADYDVAGKTIDMVDEHYYDRPQFFMDNAYKYDGYDRDGYKVYAGEYAVNAYHGLQNLEAALGEAAFMTGMERNSDVVTMTSYSELFVNLNHQNWNATAAFFDSSRIYGSPSYYAQLVFGERLGDVVLPTGFTASDGAFSTDISGGVGLGTWNTNATYSDIKVTSNEDGSVLFDGNEADDSAWTKGTGSWSVSNGAVNQTAIAADCRIWLDGKDWKNYTYEVTARKNSGNEGFLLIVGEKDSDNFYYINLGGWNNTQSAIERTSKGSKSAVTAYVPGAFEANRDYKIQVVVDKNNVKVSVDGEVLFDYTNHGSSDCPLYYVSQRDNTTGDVILKVVNTADSDYNTNIKLEGIGTTASKGEATILTSQSKYDENSFENPTNVAPVTIPVTNVSNDFNYTFMRNSITVLVIPAEDAETTLESISVTAPAKIEYTVGEELDLAGMKVTANYSDGTTKDIAAADCEVSGYDKTKTGEQTVTVTYEEKTATFKVTVKEAAKPDETDKTALEAAIKAAVPDTEKAKYTEESWTVYEKALNQAKEVLADEDAAQEEIDDAAEALDKAVKALKEKELPYVDVAESDWFYDGAYYNYFAGTMTGTDPTHFSPYEVLPRAQFATILYRMNGKPDVTYQAKFPDVPAGQFYSEAVIWAAEEKIVTGYTDSGYFGTNDPITREQIVTMMYRYANYMKYESKEPTDISKFTDAGKVTEFAEEAMKWAVGNEIIEGKENEDGTWRLDPQGNTSRAECAIIIMRFLEKYK